MAEDPTMIEPVPAVCGWKDGWYVVPHEVTWRDVDAMGHVNNAVYFTFFEWARTRYWFTLHGLQPGDRPGREDLSFIVAHAECDFLVQLDLTDQIDIRVRIERTGSTSIEFRNEIVGRREGRVAATGKVVVVLFSWARNQKMEITGELKERIRAFQGEEG